MGCNWHVQNVSHNDSLHNTACNLVYRVRRMQWRWEQVETGQPGSAVILAGMGSRWYHVADKSHSSCPPKETGDVLVLNQQLWQDISLQMSLVHPHLHPRVTCPQGTATPHSACDLFFIDCNFQSKEREFYTNQKQRYVWVESLRLYLKGKK